MRLTKTPPARAAAAHIARTKRVQETLRRSEYEFLQPHADTLAWPERPPRRNRPRLTAS